MDWEAAGAIGEIVGAAGVIATLGYLAIQTRQNTKAVNASTFMANTQLWQQWFLAISGSDVPEVFMRGLVGSPNIDGLTFQKFWNICRGLFLNFENQYYQYRRGVLDRESFVGYERVLCSMVLAWPGTRAWWMLNREGYGESFVAYIDALVETTREDAARRAANPGEAFEAWKAVLRGERPGA